MVQEHDIQPAGHTQSTEGLGPFRKSQWQELVYKLIREFPQTEHGESWKAEWGFVCVVIRKQGTN